MFKFEKARNEETRLIYKCETFYFELDEFVKTVFWKRTRVFQSDIRLSEKVFGYL